MTALPRAQARPKQQSHDGAVVRRLFRTQEVVAALGVTRRQLQYWAQTGLIEPSTRTAGGHHRYSFTDLVALKATERLLDAGVSIQRIRKCVQALTERLPQIRKPLEELVIVATGDVLLVFDEDAAFEALSGQEWVFEVAHFQREIEEWERNDVRPMRRARTVRRPKELEHTAGLSRPGGRRRRERTAPDIASTTMAPPAQDPRKRGMSCAS